MVMIHAAMSCVSEGAKRFRFPILSNSDLAVCSALDNMCYYSVYVAMIDMPEKPQSQSFFGSGLRNWCIVYMLTKEVQSEGKRLQVLFILNASLQ